MTAWCLSWRLAVTLMMPPITSTLGHSLHLNPPFQMQREDLGGVIQTREDCGFSPQPTHGAQHLLPPSKDSLLEEQWQTVLHSTGRGERWGGGIIWNNIVSQCVCGSKTLPRWCIYWCRWESVATALWRSASCVPGDRSACRGSWNSFDPQTAERRLWSPTLRRRCFFYRLVSASAEASTSASAASSPFLGHRAARWGGTAAAPGRLAGCSCWTEEGWSPAQTWPPQGHSWSNPPSTSSSTAAQTPLPAGT